MRMLDYTNSFTFNIAHIKGQLNNISDYLSSNRLAVDPDAIKFDRKRTSSSLLLALDASMDITELQRQDAIFSKIITALQLDDTTHPRYRDWQKQYVLESNILYRISSPLPFLAKC